jgi:transposase
VDAALPGILADTTSKLSGAILVLLRELKLELAQLAEKIERSDSSIEKIAQENEACQRLVTTPGIGPVISTAIIATIGNGAAFRKGRDFAAWLGVVPQEHSTGGKQTLWKIPSRGNQYLRKLFVQGARSVMQRRAKQSSGLGAWLAQLTARTHRNVAIIALANKLARIAWAVLTRNEVYRPPILDSVATT